MKLNNKRTILVGLAFLSICIFWQMYDSVMTLILTDTFHLNETIAGTVMAADNVLALFLLPLFGALSDKTDTRIGRRMPYIIGGTAAAVPAEQAARCQPAQRHGTGGRAQGTVGGSQRRAKGNAQNGGLLQGAVHRTAEHGGGKQGQTRRKGGRGKTLCTAGGDRQRQTQPLGLPQR